MTDPDASTAGLALIMGGNFIYLLPNSTLSPIGWLMAGAPTDDYVVQADVIPEGLIRTRHADLANFMVRLAAGDEWLRATPAIARKEPPEASSPEAVLEEMTGG